MSFISHENNNDDMIQHDVHNMETDDDMVQYEVDKMDTDDDMIQYELDKMETDEEELVIFVVLIVLISDY